MQRSSEGGADTVPGGGSRGSGKGPAASFSGWGWGSGPCCHWGFQKKLRCESHPMRLRQLPWVWSPFALWPDLLAVPLECSIITATVQGANEDRPAAWLCQHQGASLPRGEAQAAGDAGTPSSGFSCQRILLPGAVFSFSKHFSPIPVQRGEGDLQALLHPLSGCSHRGLQR